MRDTLCWLLRNPSVARCFDQTCKLSKSKDLTFYDAAYVSIAKVIGTKLLTADRMIISKAGEYVIPIEDFII
jgi:predicted nucleic acid-binding protein